jgi:hypothetical protein
MNSQSTMSTISNVQTERDQGIVGYELPKYALCAGMGVVGGATGVALTIGLVIIIQGLLFPKLFFTPGSVGLTLAATAVGLGVTWLLSRAAHRIFPNLFDQLGEKALQVMMVLSVFTTLLQTFLFTRGL